MFRSGQETTIQAEGEVQFSGKTVSVTTPEELVALRTDLMSPTILDICNTIDILGKKGKIISGEKKTIAPVITGETEESYDIGDIQEQVLCSLPMEHGAEAEENELFAVLAGSSVYQVYSGK